MAWKWPLLLARWAAGYCTAGVSRPPVCHLYIRGNPFARLQALESGKEMKLTGGWPAPDRGINPHYASRRIEMRTAHTKHRLLALALLAASAPAQAQSSIQASGESLHHSAEAIGLALGASAQVVSGITAIPLGLSVEVGKVSGELSEELWRAANTPLTTPLPVSEQLITVGPPPGEALRRSSE